MIDFSCDYNCGCAPEILAALTKANGSQQTTYGSDEYTLSACEKIRNEVKNPEAEVWLLVGGTQTNAVVLDALLLPTEGVICATSGHIAVHESGAIEAGGHKVLTVAAAKQGKIDTQALVSFLETHEADGTRYHMVQPGAVYISQPTELGGVYTLSELETLRNICDAHGLRLYIDGARLAYALAAEPSVTLADLGRLSDAFYIGGTKCGALFGEAVVFRKPQKYFFTLRKQHGALLAKGWLLGLQFDVLFTDGLYCRLGKHAHEMAMKIKEALQSTGIESYGESPSNQQFALLTKENIAALDGKIGYDIWGSEGDKTVVRFCSSWNTKEEDIEELIRALK